MSHFTVMVKVSPEQLIMSSNDVEEAVERMLAPYQENNMGDCPREFMEFQELESEYLEEYENQVQTRVVFPDGTTKSQHHSEFYFEDPDDDSPFPSKKFQCPEDCELKDIPFKELYSTFEEFVEKYHGEKERDPEHGLYGYWENPNKKWDWYQIGGRWRGMLRTKEGVEKGYGERSGVAVMSAQDNGDPKGYLEDQPHEADYARVGDIDFEGMDLEVDLKIDEWWEKYQKYLQFEEFIEREGYKRGERWPTNDEVEEHLGWDEQEYRDISFMDHEVHQAFYKLGIRKPKKDENGKNVENPETGKWEWEEDEPVTIEDLKTKHRHRWEFGTWAVLDAEGWKEKGEMGWWGFSSESVEEGQEWSKSFVDAFLKNEDPDTLIVIVDCHI
jgi:hypothetical protein